jgi:hypothetical protein
VYLTDFRLTDLAPMTETDADTRHIGLQESRIVELHELDLQSVSPTPESIRAVILVNCTNWRTSIVQESLVVTSRYRMFVSEKDVGHRSDAISIIGAVEHAAFVDGHHLATC